MAPRHFLKDLNENFWLESLFYNINQIVTTFNFFLIKGAVQALKIK